MSRQTISLYHIVNEPTVPSTGKPPLLVLLHGVGSNERDLIGLAPYVDPRFLVVSLRAPLTIQPGGYGWYSIEWTANGIIHDQESAIAGQAAAEKAVDELISAYDVDPSQVYLMGFSQGAILSLRIALTHPEKFAGAVIMSGRLLPGPPIRTGEPKELVGFPILVVHGTHDNVLPISAGREINEYLQTLDVNLTYHEYDMAHSVSQESLHDIAKWLTEHLDHHGVTK